MATRPVTMTGTFTGTFTGALTWEEAERPDPPELPIDPPPGPRVLAPSDIRELGALRLEIILGDGGTGNLGCIGGPPAFWKKPNGMIGMVFLGEYYSYWPTGFPLYEYEIDPNLAPHTDMASAPYATFVRNWGDIRDGHIMVAAGQRNYYSGEMTYRALDDTTGLLTWQTNEGYVPTIGWPEMSATILHHETGAFESFGPWRIDKHSEGHYRFATSILELAPAFVAQYCPGFSRGVMGQMGSGVLNSPFGFSLMAVKDFDPRSLPPATGCGLPPDVASQIILRNDYDHRAVRDDLYQICGWHSAYNCAQGSPLTRGGTVWGGSDPSVGENDAVAWGVHIDLPTVRGLLIGGALLRTPSGYTAPGDPLGLVHGWYGDPQHPSNAQNPSPPEFKAQHCCHGQACPWWGSTGPASHFRQPMGWIFDPAALATAKGLGGTQDPWTIQPTDPLGFEWKAVSPMCDVRPPQAETDWGGVFDWSGAAWVDPETHRLYVPAARDWTSGRRVMNLFVYQLP